MSGLQGHENIKVKDLGLSEPCFVGEMGPFSSIKGLSWEPPNKEPQEYGRNIYIYIGNVSNIILFTENLSLQNLISVSPGHRNSAKEELARQRL